jgi:RNA polymerase sigma-70 factor (ECF subfamily)
LGNGQVTEKEKILLAGCIRGDKASWDAFVLQYSALVYHTINKTASLHQNRTQHDFADDLFQEIFVSLIKNDFFQLRRFRGDNGCTLASWLRMIAARRTIDHLRRSKTPANSLEEPLLSGPTDDSGDQRSDNQQQLVAKALATLQPRERILIDLFFRQNLSAQDVASILHISAGAVYTQKSRILAKLREALEKLNPS